MEKQLQEKRQNKIFCRYKAVKNVIFSLLGVAVFLSYWFVPEKALVPYAAYLVGSTALAFGIDACVDLAVSGEIKVFRHKAFESVFLFVIGIVMMVAGHGDIVKCCVIWGVWAIERECMEIAEKVFELQNPVVRFLSLAESLALVVLSVSMIIHPTVHHVHEHILILGIEYLLEVLFPFLDRTVPCPGKPKRE